MIRTFIYQDRSVPPPLVPAAMDPLILGWQPDVREPPAIFAQPMPAAQQAFAALTPFGAVTPPNGWTGPQLEARFVPPFPTIHQKFDKYEPRGFIATPATPQGWYPQPPDLFAKSFPAAQQKFDHWFTPPSAFKLVGQVAFAGWQLEARFAAPFPVVAQRFDASFEPRGTIATSTPSGWTAFFDIEIDPPLNSAQQQFSDKFEPLGTILITTPQGWPFQPPDLFAKPFPHAEQRFDWWQAIGSVPLPPGPGGWWGHQLDAARVPPLGAGQQQFAAFQPDGNIPTPATPQGWWGLQLDARTVSPLPAALQQFQAFQPQGLVPVAAPPLGWLFRPPELWIYPLTAKAQQFSVAFSSRGLLPTLATPQGWQGLIRETFAKPFPHVEQQFAAWPSETIKSVSPSFGWYVQHPELFARAFRVEDQLFQAAFTPFSLLILLSLIAREAGDTLRGKFTPSPLPYKPPTGIGTLEIPWLALVNDTDPDWAALKHREVEYVFTRKVFIADPDHRGAYDSTDNDPTD